MNGKAKKYFINKEHKRNFALIQRGWPFKLSGKHKGVMYILSIPEIYELSLLSRLTDTKFSLTGNEIERLEITREYKLLLLFAKDLFDNESEIGIDINVEVFQIPFKLSMTVVMAILVMRKEDKKIKNNRK